MIIIVDYDFFLYLCRKLPDINYFAYDQNYDLCIEILICRAGFRYQQHPGTGAQDRLYADEFPLGDVTLLDGPLKKARDLNIRVLMQYDNDRLLAPYLKEAGLTPKGKSYPNWDGLDGHVGGHYLTALALNAATQGVSGATRLLDQ